MITDNCSLAIANADLNWVEMDGVAIPMSKQFGDVYFSRANGLAETKHVYINGNNLAERLPALQPYQYFCVGETGFGTGLNVLALWQLWRECRPDNHSRLHVISTEKFPLSHADLTRALNAWPELRDISEQLLAQYPPALPGCHRLIFKDERFSLDLWLGDAADYLPQIQTHHPVDAWFLDGFAPECNPELWQANILDHVVRLSAVGTTFASFSVAGMVKQGLRKHGITVTRPRGYRYKRQMLKAWWAASECENSQTLPDPSTTPKARLEMANQLNESLAPATMDKTLTSHHSPPSIAIIGAGIAGLSIAHALANRGIKSVLIDQQGPLTNASGNPRALLTPKLVGLHKFDHSLMNLGWLHTLRYWQQYSDVLQISPVVHLIEKKKEQEQQLAAAYPRDVLEAIDATQASQIANLTLQQDAIVFKQAGLLQPHVLAKHILASPLIEYRQAAVTQLQANQQQWQLLDDQQQDIACVDHVMICAARHSHLLSANLPALRVIRGQVSWMSLTQHPLACPISYGGYAAPMTQADGSNGLIVGASFVRGDAQSDLRLEDHLHNLQLLQTTSPELANLLPPIDQWQGRASVRARSNDSLPLIGQVPDMPQLWTLCGLGSKGFSFAPLCAEIICAQLLGEALPVPQRVMYNIRPARFYRPAKPSL